MDAAAPSSTHIFAIAAAGRGSQDERRMALLLEGLDHTLHSIDRRSGRAFSLAQALALMWRQRRGVVFIEGTGIVTGLPAILVSVLSRGRFTYLVSSGDAVAPYVRMKAGRVFGVLAGVYERVLYRRSFAFIGWTPHFVGRALHLGARRGVTIPGFPVVDPGPSDGLAGRSIREHWSIPESAFVIGIVGSINAPNSHGYGYGVELIGISQLLPDPSYRFLIVGDGTGLEPLRMESAPDDRFVFPGRVPAEEVPAYMRAMDATVISQTHDLVGGLRWTTKLPEFLACGVPMVVSSTPALLDLVTSDSRDSLIRVVPEARPGSSEHVQALATELNHLREESAPRARPAKDGLLLALTLEAARARLRQSLIAWRL